MIDFKNLQKMIDEKYISVQKHPTEALFIYNYTQRAQFDRVWNEETLTCRGLIMDEQKNIVARPFKKFFNLQEVIDQGGQIPAEDFVVTEKMDGSLGISYFDGNGVPSLATRGSFISEQAGVGTDILRKKYAKLYWDPAYTYLFEIIYPSNRIVVDYGETTDLFLLAVIDTHTGEEFPYEKLKEWFWGKLPMVKKHDGIADFSNLEDRPNSEGYVIAFPTTHQRFKIKHAEYVRLHRLVTGVNARSIWDLLRHEQPFAELLERVPDEFYQWVQDTKGKLEEEFNLIEALAVKHWEVVKTLPTRKEQALTLFKMEEKQKKVIPVVFALLDKKPYADIIWRMLKPKAERPFKEEI